MSRMSQEVFRISAQLQGELATLLESLPDWRSAAAEEQLCTYFDTDDCRFYRAGVAVCVVGGEHTSLVVETLRTEPAALGFWRVPVPYGFELTRAWAADPAAASAEAEAGNPRGSPDRVALVKKLRLTAAPHTPHRICSVVQRKQTFEAEDIAVSFWTLLPTADESSSDWVCLEYAGRTGDAPVQGELRERLGTALRGTTLAGARLRRLGELGLFQPPAAPPKTRYPLTKDHSTLQAARVVLAVQLRVLEYHEPGVRLGAEAEALHEFRIALRRMRSAISVFGSLLPQGLYKYLRGELRWITTPTGRLRDLDVHRLRLAGYALHQNPRQEFLIEVFERELRAARERAGRDLLRALETQRYGRLKRRLETFCAQQSDPRPQVGLQSAAPLLLGEARAAVEKQARRLGAESSDKRYHRLRKELKRYRYCCEFLSALHGKALKKHIAKMDELQLLMGEFQDNTVEVSLLNDVVLRVPLNDRRSREALVRIGERTAAVREESHRLKRRIRKEVRAFLKKEQLPHPR